MEIAEIQNEIKTQLANKETFNSLLNITFKGIQPNVLPRAILEGRMRGFTFKDFLEKNVYAIPFKDGTQYSLVSSIDYARKIGMRNGVAGKSAPIYTYKDGGAIESCTVTIKRKIGETIGDYSATVFFDEYNTGRNLWTSKPRTMIAKVAEMHALRMACPEELSQIYTEEEKEKEVIEVVKVNPEDYRSRLEGVKDLEQLKEVWASLPVEAKTALTQLKNELKLKFSKPDEGTDVRE